MAETLAVAAFESLSVAREERHLEAREDEDGKSSISNNALTKVGGYEDDIVKLCTYLDAKYFGIEVELEEIDPNFAAWLVGVDGFRSKNETCSGHASEIRYGTFSRSFPVVNGKDDFGEPVIEYLLSIKGRTFGYFRCEEDARKAASGLISTVKDAVKMYRRF